MGFGSDGVGDADDAYGETVRSTPTLGGTEFADSRVGQFLGETRSDDRIANDKAVTAAIESGSSTFIDTFGQVQTVADYAPDASPPTEGSPLDFNQPLSFSIGPIGLATSLLTGGLSKVASSGLGFLAGKADKALGMPSLLGAALNKQGGIDISGVLSGNQNIGPPTSLAPMATGAAYAKNGRAPSAPPSAPPSIVDQLDNSMLNRSRSLINRGLY